MGKMILALDQGTTSCRAILFDGNGRMIGSSSKEFRQIYPRPGWVEHDHKSCKASWRLFQGIKGNNASADDIAAIELPIKETGPLGSNTGKP